MQYEVQYEVRYKMQSIRYAAGGAVRGAVRCSVGERVAVRDVVRGAVLGCSIGVQFLFISIHYPRTTLALPPSSNSDPGSCSGPFSPLPTTVRVPSFLSR